MDKIRQHCSFLKNGGAKDICDYRPINLIHAFAKIISKAITHSLAPPMNELVSNSQSVFIKSKIPTLLFKLDIHKSFDLVRWQFIFDLLKQHGFPPLFS
jgi:hypothetical protein